MNSEQMKLSFYYRSRDGNWFCGFNGLLITKLLQLSTPTELTVYKLYNVFFCIFKEASRGAVPQTCKQSNATDCGIDSHSKKLNIQYYHISHSSNKVNRGGGI